jgi:peptide methionine sulfoxide reductase msrA/msrB
MRFLIIFILAGLSACSQTPQNVTDMEKYYNKLSPQEEKIIINKGTEAPYTGEYYKSNENGTYTCRRCDVPLYHSSNKFDSHCGWPSFDDEIPGAVTRIPDKDGLRTEIICANCGAHLGHVFTGEGFTPKDTRHCVNSTSLKFLAAGQKPKVERAIFASGCFWGSQYYLQRAKGVLYTKVGYTGGTKANPSYQDVCTGTTGHAEAVEVFYDPAITNYENVTKVFFETHDFTQINRQGPDVGEQYRTAIFYIDNDQKQTAEKLIKVLTEKGYKVATQLNQASVFWVAELYHQDYYNKKGGTPYCHVYRKIF